VKTEIIFAGHGGQGVLELANNVSYLEVLRGRHVAYTPSYGPESRGGKVKCYVVFSDGVIDSPIVEEPDYLVVMNIPSMDYVPLLRSGGTLLMNSSLILSGPEREDIVTIRVPATGIADGLKGMEAGGIQDTRIVGNSVMLGAYLAVTGESLDTELLERVFGHFLTDRKAASIPINLEAARRGYQFIADATVAARI
jgi:2-oxoglutarate ferredoxin oxidoreductase subunit gamma